MDLYLTGKTALVTGASRGIGLAIVRALAAEGATVIGCARTVTNELAGSGAHAIVGDLTTAAGPSEVVESVLGQHGDIDILVNNVGAGTAGDLRAVSPGPTRTSLWTDPHGFGAAVAAAQGISHADLLAGLATGAGIRSGQLVEPERVASFIAYLASPLAASITGHEYLIDGGAIKTA